MPSINHGHSSHSQRIAPDSVAHLPVPGSELSRWLQARPETHQPVYRRAIESLIDRGEDGITMNQMVIPLVSEVANEPQSSQLSLARALCLVMAEHNQAPWLHERMTFHALADIQQWSHTAAASAAILEPRHRAGEPPDHLGIIQVECHKQGNRPSYGHLQRDFWWMHDQFLYKGTMNDGFDGLFPVKVDPDRVGVPRMVKDQLPWDRAILVFDPAEQTFEQAADTVRRSLNLEFLSPTVTFNTLRA